MQSGSQDQAGGWCGSQTCNYYSAWVENLTGGNNGNNEDPPIYPWGTSGLNYNVTVYSENWTNSTGGNATSEVGIYNTADWYTTNSFYEGHNWGAAIETAEAILEDSDPYDQPRFSSIEFDAISVFDNNSGYSHGMDNSWHDFTQVVGSSGYYLDTVGPLNYNSAYNPPVTNTITWDLYT